MTGLAEMPPAVAVPIAVVALIAACLAFTGSLGLVRLKTFYDRVHAPTLASTLGLYLMVAAVIAWSWFTPDGPAWRVVLIAPAVVVTAPIGLLLLVRAAVGRDGRAEARDRDAQPPRS